MKMRCRRPEVGKITTCRGKATKALSWGDERFKSSPLPKSSQKSLDLLCSLKWPGKSICYWMGVEIYSQMGIKITSQV